jgi:Na+/H+ antiporter NhaD/arsenite permease-like protein
MPIEPVANPVVIPSPAWALPFAALLLAIAVFPLLPRVGHWWEHNHHKLLVGLSLGLFVLGYYALRGYGVQTEDGHGLSRPGFPTLTAVAGHAILEEFTPFMVLLFSLYVISGGLQLRGDLIASPLVNTGFLAAGAGLASLIGTTGASMLLIRPLLQTNRDRVHVRHTVVFFIFLVSNIGGCLLPLGDPPLFLGYLRGVPFLWTARLVIPWLFCIAVLLAVYLAWDSVAIRREPAGLPARERRHMSPLRLHGSINLAWLAVVVLSVALIVPGRALPGTDIVVADFVREAIMLAVTGLSLATTPRGLRKEVEFSYGAIMEVACLFLGIFLTMQVPIEILRARGPELGLTSPAHFFWATGLLSGVLDNAPTYVVFFETARSIAIDPAAATVRLLDGGLVGRDLLRAISLGSVFMGANTYIGNGPNFMVKSIAEAQGVKMPGFFGYMAYSGAILIPLFALVTFVFFR